MSSNQNSYLINQQSIFKEASQLALNGEDCSHLVQHLDPEYSMRLRVFVKDLPEEIRKLSLFGRANPPIPKAKPKRKS
jgi:hypothetical protein